MSHHLHRLKNVYYLKIIERFKIVKGRRDNECDQDFLTQKNSSSLAKSHLRKNSRLQTSVSLTYI